MFGVIRLIIYPAETTGLLFNYKMSCSTQNSDKIILKEKTNFREPDQNTDLCFVYTYIKVKNASQCITFTVLTLKYQYCVGLRNNKSFSSHQ